MEEDKYITMSIKNALEIGFDWEYICEKGGFDYYKVKELGGEALEDEKVKILLEDIKNL